MKKLLFVLCLFIFFKSYAQNSDLSVAQKTRMEATIERDENGLVLGFDYFEIKEQVGNDNFVKYLFSLLNVSTIVCHFNDTDQPIKYTKDNQTNLIRSAPYEDGPHDPTIHALFDKKNWRRPGCLPKTGAVCLISY